MVEMRAVVKTFSEPMKHLDALIVDGKFHYNGDPVLTWMFSNVVAHYDNKDNVYPKKERPENKIDGVVALRCAWDGPWPPIRSRDRSTKREGPYSYEGIVAGDSRLGGSSDRKSRARMDLSSPYPDLNRQLPHLCGGEEPLMGLLTKAFERRSNLSNPDPWLVFLMGGPTTAAGMRVNPDTAMRFTAVYGAVRILAETVATLPLIVYRRLPNEGKERATDYFLYRLLHDQPNEEQTRTEFVEMLQGHLALRGNAYAQIDRRRANPRASCRCIRTA